MSSEKQLIASRQLVEWLSNPVTIAFKDIAETSRLEAELAKGIDVYHPFEPYKTQEVFANLNGVVDTWDLILEGLSKDGIEGYFNEYE